MYGRIFEPENDKINKRTVCGPSEVLIPTVISEYSLCTQGLLEGALFDRLDEAQVNLSLLLRHRIHIVAFVMQWLIVASNSNPYHAA